MDSLESFLLWCLILNSAIYMITAFAVMFLGDFVYKVNMKIFSLDQQSVAQAVQSYLAHYKLMITFFNFVPWLALLIINP
jgi:hypothetical protein